MWRVRMTSAPLRRLARSARARTPPPPRSFCRSSLVASSWASSRRCSVRRRAPSKGALQLYRSTAKAILQRAAAGSSEASGSLAAKLAKCAESEGSALTPSAVADEMTGLLLAGHETSSNTATWALHLLAPHPREQEQVRAEVAA